MEAKKELLNQAIATLDGNYIMAVVLFIKKSVDQCKSLFLCSVHMVGVLTPLSLPV